MPADVVEHLATIATKFALGTPPVVCGLINAALALPNLDPRMRAGIERLAGDQAMAGLWQGDMPPALLANAAAVIEYAIVAYGEAVSLPKTKEHAEFAKLVPDRQIANLQVSVRSLHQDLSEVADRLRPRWLSSLTLDDLLTGLADLTALCDRLKAEAAAIDNLLALPEPPRKLGSRTAPQVYFSQAMKGLFERIFGQPHAKIVATLEQVVFDLPQGVDDSTVLKR